MRSPYLFYNELFHPAGPPTDDPSSALGRVDLSRCVPTAVKQKRRKALRLRSFEIACVIAAGEMSAAPRIGA